MDESSVDSGRGQHVLSDSRRSQRRGKRPHTAGTAPALLRHEQPERDRIRLPAPYKPLVATSPVLHC